MRVGACQTREIIGDLDAAVRAIHGFTDQANDADVDLLLLPECFLQGYLVTPEHVREQAMELRSTRFAAVLTQFAAIRQTLVLGVIERQENRYYNTAVVIAAGQIIGSYRKRYLTPGETLFSAGDNYPVFDCGGVQFGINIC